MCHFILIGFYYFKKIIEREKRSQFPPSHQEENSVLVFGAVNLLLQWIACNLIRLSTSSNILVFFSDIKGTRLVKKIYFYFAIFIIIKISF